jgi:hypothetical protein
MLLLITGCKKNKECAEALTRATRYPVDIAESIQRALTHVHKREYVALVVDQWIAENDPDRWESLLKDAGMALPIYINLAITGKERLVREVQHALKKQEQARMLAMKSAESSLRSELREAITGVLLASELALKSEELPTSAAQKMQAVYGTALKLRARFETVQ